MLRILQLGSPSALTACTAQENLSPHLSTKFTVLMIGANNFVLDQVARKEYLPRRLWRSQMKCLWIIAIRVILAQCIE